VGEDTGGDFWQRRESRVQAQTTNTAMYTWTLLMYNRVTTVGIEQMKKGGVVLAESLSERSGLGYGMTDVMWRGVPNRMGPLRKVRLTLHSSEDQ
jgi:hypothetical protein